VCVPLSFGNLKREYSRMKFNHMEPGPVEPCRETMSRANAAAAPPQEKYWLTQHIHICHRDRHILLLDAKSDQYVGMSESDSIGLSRWIEGWPISKAAAKRIADDDCVDLLNQLIERDILTANPNRGKLATPVAHLRPEVALIEGYADVPFEIRAKDVANFLRAALLVKAQLRWCSLQYIVERIRSRKQQRLRSGARVGADLDFDLAETRRNVAVFRRLQPLLFTAPGACLFDSLVLTEFLARYRVLPALVFAVSTGPFAAHCWLQHESIVLNDSPDALRRFTPIMVI
jgi:hypothetical protein